MKPDNRQQLKQKILDEIEAQKTLIQSLTETSKPVAPDNAIGRLTRMEAIVSKGVSEASLNSAQIKLSKLETALAKVEDPDFGLCLRCGEPIPHGRIMLMPESTCCVACASGNSR
ncbi:MAG: hypothetical protein G3M70_02685 [Candidatus Nitronauta litoralis]|uniref:Zinc finger DksA/TraR C4-type domain-containing protein n=1 Tax=Candidatus Nitronauta litoralis TaxID=2705533 RepID=A0A7T0BTV9_9BACT|nr:MAG: hypothetical protein G3M70_02685 [Candidatus Nitronauta litoralis]